MIVAGVDQSKTQSGVGILDQDDPSMMICKSIRCAARRGEGIKPGANDAEYDGEVAFLFKHESAKLFRKYSVTHLALEMPIQTKGGGQNHTTSIICGAVALSAREMRIPVVYVASASWRSDLGFRFPPRKMELSDREKIWALDVLSRFKNGRPYVPPAQDPATPGARITLPCDTRKWLKAQAIDWCIRKGVRISNVDEAEGACITFYRWRQLRLAMRAPRDLFEMRGAA